MADCTAKTICVKILLFFFLVLKHFIKKFMFKFFTHLHCFRVKILGKYIAIFTPKFGKKYVYKSKLNVYLKECMVISVLLGIFALYRES